jgi:hypothetical protein
MSGTLMDTGMPAPAYDGAVAPNRGYRRAAPTLRLSSAPRDD